MTHPPEPDNPAFQILLRLEALEILTVNAWIRMTSIEAAISGQPATPRSAELLKVLQGCVMDLQGPADLKALVRAKLAEMYAPVLQASRLIDGQPED